MSTSFDIRAVECADALEGWELREGAKPGSVAAALEHMRNLLEYLDTGEHHESDYDDDAAESLGRRLDEFRREGWRLLRAIDPRETRS
jgi:hypothetical protein